MIELFEGYWWLLFPLSWFVFGAYRSWLSYKANRDTLDLIKTYAQAGREPPPELMAKLNRPFIDEEDREDRADRYERRRARRDLRGWDHGRRGPRGWYHVVLFAVLCAGFAYAGFTDMYGAGQAFVIVAFVMAALSLASAVSLLVERGPKA